MKSLRNNLIKFIGLSLGLVLSFGSICFEPSKIVKEVSAVGNYVVDPTTYYNSITATSGSQLLSQLHTLMGETHKYYSSYDDCKNPNIVYALEPGTSSKYITDFYTQKDIDKSWGSGAVGTWNREHVWCQSLSSSLYGTTYAGSDLHHLRPIESTLNSTRNNHPYGELSAFGVNRENYIRKVKNKSGVYTDEGGYLKDKLDVWEPLDGVKGDIARILFYVYTHYSNKTGGTDGSCSGHTADLKIYNIVSAVDPKLDVSTREKEAWNLLLEWNNNDPVDSREINRNNQASTYQGNRNPFIDHPEYANAIWGDSEVHLIINKNNVKLENIGDTETVIATSSDGKNYSVTWNSSDSDVASITSATQTGQVATIKAEGKGSCQITGTASINGKQKTVTCLVNVGSSEPIPVGNGYFKVTSEPSDWSGTYLLAHDVSDSKTYVWSGEDKASCYYEVGTNNGFIDLSDISDKAATLAIAKGANSKYTVKVNNGTFNNKFLYHTGSNNTLNFADSYNDNVLNSLSFDKRVLITAEDGFKLKFNNADNAKRFRYYKAEDGVELYKLMTNVPVSSVSLNKNSLTLNAGQTETLIATVLPENASDKSVSWSIEDSTVATVDDDGKITGISGGETVVSVITNDGLYIDTCSITILNPLNSITLGGNYPTIFFKGQDFISDGLIVTAHYLNGSSEVVDGEVIAPDMSTAGKKKVIVNYEDKSASYFIDVIEREGAYYEVASTSKVNVSNAPSGSDATYEQMGSQKNRLISGDNATLTLSKYTGYFIKNIYLSMKSNTSSGSGYLVAKRGSTEICSIGSSTNPLPFSNAQWFGSYITKYVNLKLDLTNVDNPIDTNETISIKIYSTENSLYIESFTVDYEKASLVESLTLSNIVSSFNVGGDFIKPTVTAHYDNGSNKNVTAFAQFTGNDLSEEGCKTVTVSYSELGKTVTAKYLIIVIDNTSSTPKYNLVKNINDLNQGDKITIVSTEPKDEDVIPYVAIEPYHSNDNNCKKVDIPAPIGETITTDKISDLTLGKKDGNWTLFDGTYYLYAAGGTSNKNNYMKGANSANNSNAQWSISFDEESAIIKTCDDTVVKNTIRYNRTSDVFSCYSTSQTDIYIYKLDSSKDDSLQKAQEYAVKLINSITCYNGEKTPIINGTTWSSLASEYDSLVSDVKTIFVNADYTISGTIVTPSANTDQVVANAVAKYDQLVSKYSKTYNNFMNRNIAINNAVSILNKFNEAPTIVIIFSTIVSIACVGLYFFINKRKKTF